MENPPWSGQHVLSQFLLDPANFLIVTISMIAMDLCVWDPGRCFEFIAHTDFTENASSIIVGMSRQVFLKCRFKLFE